jgi:serine/threonine protein kinase
MANPVTTAADYCTLLAKSKLLPAEEVDSLYKKWKEEKPGGDERVDSFRRFLVGRKSLTEYQARLVQRGHTDNFFLDGYKILDQIGKGHMGGVYKAVHTFGQVVALKILPASKAKNTHILGRFQREARLLTQLDHPNVVRAFQVGESGGVHYIVMEFLEGETLDAVLERRTRLPVAEAARLMCQALDGLQHLHDRRTVHRDMKPSNLMLTPELEKGKPDTTWDATLKILDIGLGRELFDENAPEGQIETQLTQEGSVLGTPDYLAPEQAKDARSADIRSDIYSVGCVFYHCLAGRPPFPETNIMAQMVKHATEQAVPLSAFVEGLPDGLQPVVDRFLAKTPGERFQTPAEAAKALEPFATGGAPARSAKMVPAFQVWLTSESQTDMPKPPQVDATVKSPAPPTPAQQTVKSGTAPAPAVAGGAAKPAARSGTEPKPALKTGAAPPAAKPAAAPKPAKPAPAPRPAPAARPLTPTPAVIPQPVPLPAPALPAPVEEEVDVELVTMPEPAAFPEMAPAAQPAPVAEERPFWPPDRRDWIMLAVGAVSVISAVGTGYGLAKLLKRKDPEPPTE